MEVHVKLREHLTRKIPWIVFVDINLFDEFNTTWFLFHLPPQIEPNKLFICGVKSEAREPLFLLLIIILRTDTATHPCHGLHLSLSLSLSLSLFLLHHIYDIERGALQVCVCVSIYIYCVR